MIPIPAHLTHLAASPVENAQKGTVMFSLNCPCGSGAFTLWQNCLTRQERAKWDAYAQALLPGGYATMMTVDADGGRHHWKAKEPLCEEWEEYFPPEEPADVPNVTAIKAVCAHCGREHLLFDSRRHGYDAMTTPLSEADAAHQPRFHQKTRKPMGLWVVVENLPSLEAFRAEFGPAGEREYSNSFSWIWLYGISETGKRRKLWEWESG